MPIKNKYFLPRYILQRPSVRTIRENMTGKKELQKEKKRKKRKSSMGKIVG